MRPHNKAFSNNLLPCDLGPKVSSVFEFGFGFTDIYGCLYIITGFFGFSLCLLSILDFRFRFRFYQKVLGIGSLIFFSCKYGFWNRFHTVFFLKFFILSLSLDFRFRYRFYQKFLGIGYILWYFSVENMVLISGF